MNTTARRNAGFSILDVVVVLLVLIAAALLLTPALMKAKSAPARVRCSNQLRQIAIALIQYGDDHRALPHVTGPQTLDGDETSNHGSVAIRLLVWGGYFDTPDRLICSNSAEAAVAPIASRFLWTWGGRARPQELLTRPLATGPGVPSDPSLAQNTELSYAYTRRALNPNVRADTVLIADEAALPNQAALQAGCGGPPGMLGNHVEGWNVARADGSVEWRSLTEQPFTNEWLRDTSGPGDGYLPVLPQAREDLVGP